MESLLSLNLQNILKIAVWKCGMVKTARIRQWLEHRYPMLRVVELKTLEAYWEKFVGKVIVSAYTSRPLAKRKSFNVRRNIK